MKYLLASSRVLALALFTVAASGCGAGEDEELTGADEEVASSESFLAGNLKEGGTLRTTANLNLRAGASTSFDILVTMPLGSTVTVLKAAPQNGFYNVKYASQTGWAHGAYLAAAGGGPPAVSGNKAVKIGGPAVRGHVQSFANAACGSIGCPYELGTRVGHDPSADRAVDMMMAKYGTRAPDGGAHGMRIANFALANEKTYKVYYVIWFQKINTADGRGWRAMADRGSNTQNHYDHVHVSFDP